jgi:hypothetical protein
MNKKQINELYIQRFIHSMEEDYQNWKMSHCAGPGWAWTEFHSPDYTNDTGRISFGFSLNHVGAWIDGYFQWSLPVRNPFTKTFWRFRRAKNQMKNHLREAEEREYINRLNSVL